MAISCGMRRISGCDLPGVPAKQGRGRSSGGICRFDLLTGCLRRNVRWGLPFAIVAFGKCLGKRVHIRLLRRMEARIIAQMFSKIKGDLGERRGKADGQSTLRHKAGIRPLLFLPYRDRATITDAEQTHRAGNSVCARCGCPVGKHADPIAVLIPLDYAFECRQGASVYGDRSGDA